MRRLWIILLMALAVTVVGWRLHERRVAARQAAIERSLLREWALTQAGLARSAPQAGLSLERRDIRSLDSKALEKASDLPGFRQYLHRCEACHQPPDPTLHQPAEWPGVVDRMGLHVKAAGLFPLSPDERAGIVRFLEAASQRP